MASREWKLICATHNLLKFFLHRIGLAASAPRHFATAEASALA